MKTHAVKASEIKRQWYVIDATGQTLGRLATRIAQILKGKHKPIYSSHLDAGDYVIVINASKIKTTGKKLTQKIYYRHSGYPGGLKSESLGSLLTRKPRRVIEMAVRGMLPHNTLGRAMFKKLKVYEGNSHPHQSQMPKELKMEADGKIRITEELKL
ncbi:MAG: 50S ribosomal protein L13 [Chloroflexi bacterium]|nr:50S ribosomal protein L13 [Chloroflexota bacterium]MCL5074943.1 50S ribosomal protein L13 [Chloroflexota bacterium]